MLNRSAPYCQVFGMEGVSWEQDGQLFDYAGRPVDGEGQHIEMVERPSAADDLEEQHHRTLQAMLSQYGEPYHSREQAIRRLREIRQGRAQ